MAEWPSNTISKDWWNQFWVVAGVSVHIPNSDMTDRWIYTGGYKCFEDYNPPPPVTYLGEDDISWEKAQGDADFQWRIRGQGYVFDGEYEEGAFPSDSDVTVSTYAGYELQLWWDPPSSHDWLEGISPATMTFNELSSTGFECYVVYYDSADEQNSKIVYDMGGEDGVWSEELRHGGKMINIGGMWACASYSYKVRTITFPGVPYDGWYQGLGTTGSTDWDGNGDRNYVIMHATDPGGDSNPYISISFRQANNDLFPTQPPTFSCFLTGTTVTMADGTRKDIEHITEGDQVISYDVDNNINVISTVTRTFKHENTPGYLIINNNLRVTPNHEMYTGSEWKAAGDLKVNGSLQSLRGLLILIESIEKSDEVVTTYNIEVDSEHHNYWANGILAHNKTVVQYPPPVDPPPTTSCFLAGTKIAGPGEWEQYNIEDIEVGDRVMCYNTDTHKHEVTTVTQTFEHPNIETYLLVNDVLHVTPNHDMFDGNQWRPIGQFDVGDYILYADGELRRIDTIDLKPYKNVTTYNIEVESDHHNYFADGYLAHNKTIWCAHGTEFDPSSMTCVPTGGKPIIPVCPPPPRPTGPVPPVTPKPPTSCFTGETKIVMGDDTNKLIRDIQVGNVVKVCNTDTNEIIESKVTKVFIHKDVQGYLIINEELHVTPEHPLYDGGIWRPARDYQIGDAIQYIDHTYKNISSIERRSETVTVYNIEVESKYHNYYAEGYLAHNKTMPWPPPPGRPPVCPPPPTKPPGGGGDPTKPTGPPTTTPTVSTNMCGGITSKEYIIGKADWSGQTTSFTRPNTRPSRRTGTITTLIAYALLPLKHLNYQKVRVFFYIGFDKDGHIACVSDPRYGVNNSLDRNNSTGYDCNVAASSAKWVSTPPVPSDAFETYQLYIDRIITAGPHEALHAPFFASIKFNPVTDQFRDFRNVTGQNPLLTRTLTAVNGTSVVYVPTNGYNVLCPLKFDGTGSTDSDERWLMNYSNDGSLPAGQAKTPHLNGEDAVTFVTLTSSYSANHYDICYEVESRNVPASGETYYNLRGFPIVGGLNPPPHYQYTTNTQGNTGCRPNLDTLQGSLAIVNRLERPRKRHPVACGSLLLDHHDFQPRHYGLFNIKYSEYAYRELGFNFNSTDADLADRWFAITPGQWFENNTPAVTAARIKFEHNQNTSWGIADFSWFTGLSAHAFAQFLQAYSYTSKFESVSSDVPYLQLLGFCTYNSKLTAADGSYYCAALARCNNPPWCTPAAEIGGTANPSYANYVVCTSGNNLILPYITYTQ